MATNIFELTVLILGVYLDVYILSQKVTTVSFYIQGESVFPTV